MKSPNLDWYLALYLMYLIGTLVVTLAVVLYLGGEYFHTALIASIFVPAVPVSISVMRNRDKGGM